MKNSKTLLILLSLSLLSPSLGWSAQMRTLKKQKKAYFAEDTNGFFKGLSLITKQYRFTSRDTLKCGANLNRHKEFLDYFCTIDLPHSDHVNRLHKQLSENVVTIGHGRLKKKVRIQVNENGKSVQFSMSFDKTSFDWELIKFNDEFFAVYAKAAHTTISKAMRQTLVKVQTIENK